MATLGTTACSILAKALLVAAASHWDPVAAAPTTPPLSPQDLFARFYKASLRADQAANHIVTFDGEADASSADMIADAGDIASEAISTLATQPDGKRLLTEISGVRIAAGPLAAVTVNDGVIVIAVNPFDREAGIPSAFRIERAVDAEATRSVEGVVSPNLPGVVRGVWWPSPRSATMALSAEMHRAVRCRV